MVAFLPPSLFHLKTKARPGTLQRANLDIAEGELRRPGPEQEAGTRLLSLLTKGYPTAASLGEPPPKIPSLAPARAKHHSEAGTVATRSGERQRGPASPPGRPRPGAEKGRGPGNRDSQRRRGQREPQEGSGHGRSRPKGAGPRPEPRPRPGRGGGSGPESASTPRLHPGLWEGGGPTARLLTLSQPVPGKGGRTAGDKRAGRAGSHGSLPRPPSARSHFRSGPHHLLRLAGGWARDSTGSDAASNGIGSRPPASAENPPSKLRLYPPLPVVPNEPGSASRRHGDGNPFLLPPILWGGASEAEFILAAFTMAEESGSCDPIGTILVKVQDDLYQLKRDLHIARDGKELIDIQALEKAIERTKLGIRVHVENYLSTISHRVLTTTVVDSEICDKEPSKELHPVGVPQKAFLFPQESVGKKWQGKKEGKDIPFISPGTKLKTELHLKILHDPEHAYHRAAVNQSYGISLPFINKRKPGRVQLQKIIKGTTVENLGILTSHRKNPYLTPLPILEKDAKKGILSMIQRGLIPPAAKITFETPPIIPKTAFLHSYKQPKTKSRRKFGKALPVINIDNVELPKPRDLEVKIPPITGERGPPSSSSFSSILKTQSITKPKVAHGVKSKIVGSPMLLLL
ncbi:uncharacterized protein ACOB8E_010048 [Sarcophilus harrisii]